MLIRSALSFALCLALAQPALGSAATIVPSSAERSAFALGVTKQTAVDIFQSPRACGAVILRPRCVAAIKAFFAVPTDSRGRIAVLAFAQTGDLATFDPAFADANSTGPANQMPWSAEPTATWLQLAGIAYVMGTGETGPLQDLAVDERFDGLAGHLREAGPYARLVDSDVRANISTDPASPVLTPGQADMFRASLLPKLEALFPIAADPNVVVAFGPLGDLEVGVYMATWNEMAESPVVEMEPQGRAFLARLVDHIIAGGGSANGWTTERFARSIASARSAEDLRALYDAVQALEATYLQHQPRENASRTVTGLYAAQGAYNAAVLHELPYDAAVRGFMRDAGALDAHIDGFGEARKAFLATKSGDWVAENAALSAVVRSISELAH